MTKTTLSQAIALLENTSADIVRKSEAMKIIRTQQRMIKNGRLFAIYVIDHSNDPHVVQAAKQALKQLESEEME